MDGWMQSPVWFREAIRALGLLSATGPLDDELRAERGRETRGVAARSDGTARISEIPTESTSSRETPKSASIPPLPHPFHLDSAAFQPDGAGLVTVGHPSQGIRSVAVRNWVLTSPPSVAVIQGVKYNPRFASPDQEPARRIASAHESLFAARFVPGGDAIVLFFRDGTMRLWQPWHSLEPGAIVPVAKSPYFSETAFSEQGAVMVIPLENNQLQVWDFAKQALLISPISRQAAPNGAHFLPFALNRDGQRLATTNYDSSADKRSVSIWDTTTQRLLRTLPIDTSGDLFLSGDGRRLATEASQPDGVVIVRR